EQLLQCTGQGRCLRQAGACDQGGYKCEVAAGQCVDQLVANHIVLVVKPLLVIRVRPARTNYGNADRASIQCVVDLVAPPACADAMNVAKYVLPTKGNAQPVVEPAARAPCVITTVAYEDVVTNSCLRFIFHC